MKNNGKKTKDQINQELSDLNTFAGMKTTQEDRIMILKEWAKISKQQKALAQE